ncbi:site-specific DNA-methyltransferase [Campylobacter sp. MIT 97-5078]|uniref:site-specific DNA-methyltransferase n=1 Tax=Campylobacter sp. MIT 97-5078 TaxID=1548153 RepID=UPI00051302A9|nr:site-specific DNA-methyltransferase [Campylobacter sp. MIT 97-5078]KGI56321.1 hypothetical protein LR59_07805 [Campylobacter sp. MIT 97-5078]KGI57550.1 hypothetical protein LR59_02335 [Campylobacter sp. MIT 97-5078]KGI57753.1 hypothetical protein LR59_03480 [Campylobacter sp. MIT 97-5078]TQR26926.1 site-specific DNA-methyltransferase [Campylobacter sp. MIT 97-5078]
MNYKLEFYSRLESSYLGSKIKDIKDKSGFTNLLEIKAKYFKHLKSKLENFIGADTYENQDIYNKLYTFFDTYLNETGTPFFNDTPIYKNIYARVYSNSSDTSLFYKTQDLYYVKSDTLYKDMVFEGENYILSFDASEFKQNADNTKNKIFFKIKSIEQEEQDLQIKIKVSNQKELFEDLSNVFKQNSSEFSEDFLKAIKPYKLDEEALKKDFSSYKRQNEVDFFIHKNAREFLNEQFDLWLFSYLHKDDKLSDFTQETLAKITKIKDAARLTIDLIADFEDELKSILLKPKFAKKVEYVLSIDIIKKAKSQNSLIDSIFSDKGFESQIKEWQELSLIDESFKKEDFITNDKYRYLSIDTKHLSKETKYKILNAFEDLESILNGELIKADNFQALNTLMPKYQGKVDLIYIDPPFNTGSDFEYKDKFQDSTWLSLMENRLELARKLLNPNGSFWLQLDFNADSKGRLLLDNIFGDDSFVNEIFWKRRQGLVNQSASFGANIDVIFYYVKNPENYIFNPQYTKYNTDEYIKERYIYKDSDGRIYKLGDLGSPSYSPTLIYEYKGYKPPKKGWALSLETMKKFDSEGRIWFPDDKSKRLMRKQYLDEWKGKYVQCLWDDIFPINSQAMEKIDGQFTQKPEALLQRIIKASSNENSTILDFFAGSGTTLAVAQKLGRKWLGVEMGEHFYNVIIPRLKKVIAGFASGISKECNYQGGGAFRYYELESYEEALANCEYVLDCKEAKKAENKNNYKGKDYAKAKAILDYRKSRKLIDRLHKGEIVSLDMSTEYREGFDIFHTMANLMCWKIKRLFLDSKGIESCEFDNGEILSLDSLDLAKYPKLKNLIWWE